jgi:hypothetical protein
MYTFLLPVLLFTMGVVPADDGHVHAATPDNPVRLVEIVGPRTLEVGAVGHFRARVSDRSARPVNYLWDLGDGTLSVGALVSYAYATPGPYTVTVVARNAAGRDTLEVPVYVEEGPVRADSAESTSGKERSVTAGAPREIEAADVPRRPGDTVPRNALYGGGGIVGETGGYAWVVATDLWAERARTRVLRYRLRGFRADVYVDTAGRGSPAHRVVLGQFTTRAEALAARPWLPEEARGAWLLELVPAPKDK